MPCKGRGCFLSIELCSCQALLELLQAEKRESCDPWEDDDDDIEDSDCRADELPEAIVLSQFVESSVSSVILCCTIFATQHIRWGYNVCTILWELLPRL